MNAARRDKRRRDWPARLYEPRPGYFVWRHPTTGETHAIGRVPFAHARAEAIAANAYVSERRPSIVERLQGAGHTVEELLERMPVSENPNTAKSQRSLDGKLRAALGGSAVSSVTVAQVASLIEAEALAGKSRSAQALRSRAVAVFRRAQALGWIKDNPAQVTEAPRVKVKRSRLTFEQFQAIHAVAGQVAEWLPHAMMLALVTGQDRSTVAAMERSHVSADALTTWRTKTRATNQPVEIPLALRMDAVGVSLAELVKHRTGVVSRYLVHHVSPWGNAPSGSKVHPDRMSHAFTEARKLAGIPDESSPTFHEIRSLSARLYKEQGGVDVQALLGHATKAMTEKYQDPRGATPVKVRLLVAK